MRGEKKRLLFVDDEVNFLAGIQRMLRGQKNVWDMDFVHSVAEALEAVAKNDYDAIFSDVRMPNRDGFDLLRELRSFEKTKDLPIVMLTGMGDEDLKCLALNQGATDLLAKPVTLEDILARARSVLRLKSYQDDLKEMNRTLGERVAARTRDLENSRLDIIWRLAKAGEYRDEATGHHIARVGFYSRLLASEMKMPRNVVENVFLTAPLHDIGKIGIPDSLLLKPGRLSPEEREVMEKHCALGVEILRQEPRSQTVFMKYAANEAYSQWTQTGNPLLDMAVSIAMNHHERWDGSGYPEGRAGEDIPIEARIVALTDVYDALSSDRPYRPAFSERRVLSIMREEAEAHFDPDVFRAFEGLTSAFRAVRAEFSEETGVGVPLASQR
jgi:putative two-component system response regulator